MLSVIWGITSILKKEKSVEFTVKISDKKLHGYVNPKSFQCIRKDSATIVIYIISKEMILITRGYSMCLNLAQRYFHCRNIEHNDRSENDTL